MQMRKARDFQRLAERENEGQGGGAPGYRGPDGSGQWVSMGELCGNDLELCWEAWEEVNSSLTIRQCKFGNAPDPNSLL